MPEAGHVEGSPLSRQAGWWAAARSPEIHLQALLVVAVVLGGGGLAYGTRNLPIQLFALFLLALHAGAVARFARTAPIGVRLLMLGTLLLPLVMLVPLPPSLWQALPGRETVLASHIVAGFGDGLWFPASVDRARTLVAFTGLIVPATVIALGALLSPAGRRRLAWTLVGSALAVVLFGLLQLQSGNRWGLLYPVNPGQSILYGTFANRNSTGLLFVIAATVAIALADRARQRTMIAAGIAAVLLFIGTILTQSRSSMVLLVVPLAFLALRGVGLILRRGDSARPLASAGAAVMVLGALATGAVVVSALQGGRVADSIARFEDRRTDRPDMWEDGLYAAGQYWPVGSGPGTFDEVFQLHESLEYISPRRAGRAHSDWIELAMEAGIFGLALAAAWLAWIALAVWQNLRRGPLWLGAGAGVAASAIALQSLLDYPLRNQTLLCVAGVLVALMAVPRAIEREP